MIEISKDDLEKIFLFLQEEKNKGKSYYQFKVSLLNETLIKLLYYTCLDKEIILNLKVEDLKFPNNELTTIHKGNKYYVKIQDNNLIELLSTYIRVNKPQYYLFENISRGKKSKLSCETLENIVKNIFDKTGVNNNKKKYYSLRLRATRIKELREREDYAVFYFLGYGYPKSTNK